MSTPKKPEVANTLDVEAGDRAVNYIVKLLGAASVAAIAEAVFDFTEEVSASAALGLGALCAGSAFFMRYVNQRDRGGNNAQ